MASDEVLIEPGVDRFDRAELDRCPEPVRRHLLYAIAPGAPVARSASVELQGRIKLGR